MSHETAPVRDKEIVVETVNLSKTYSMGKTTVSALKNVSLEIKRGEHVSIMGPSGSGKSTLMHLLGCLDLPTSGSYFLNQIDISSLDDKTLSSLRANEIGFVFQSYNLIPQMTVYENVEVPFLYQESLRQDKKRRILESIDLVGLSHRLHHLPSQLSGGEMQRIAIARALAIDPVLILADEPTGNLDSETGHAILKLFQELNAQGVTLVIVTHDEFVGRTAKRKICMHDGSLVKDEKL